MKASLYPFTDFDGLATPPNYMYFPMQGLPFLRDYEENRERFLASLPTGSAVQPLTKEAALALAGKLSASRAEAPEEFFTAGELADAAIGMLLKLPERAATGRELAEKMLRKFEVTKKIYPSYEPPFRKGLRQPRQLEAYYGFGLALCSAHLAKPNLRYLNSLLKLNDILVSAGPSGQEPAFAGFLIHFELEQMRALEREKGVRS